MADEIFGLKEGVANHRIESLVDAHGNILDNEKIKELSADEQLELAKMILQRGFPPNSFVERLKYFEAIDQRKLADFMMGNCPPHVVPQYLTYFDRLMTNDHRDIAMKLLEDSLFTPVRMNILNFDSKVHSEIMERLLELMKEEKIKYSEAVEFLMYLKTLDISFLKRFFGLLKTSAHKRHVCSRINSFLTVMNLSADELSSIKQLLAEQKK